MVACHPHRDHSNTHAAITLRGIGQPDLKFFLLMLNLCMLIFKISPKGIIILDFFSVLFLKDAVFWGQNISKVYA